MKKLANVVYAVKILLFVSHFYLVYVMLHNIIDTGIPGIIFLTLYIIFAVKVFFEVLSQNKKYKEDIIYNTMQIGFLIYMFVISLKTNAASVYVTRITLSYFKINYLILSALIVFILLYNMLDNKSSTK